MSNIRLGVYPNLHSHPLPLFYAAHVPFSVNSDDPSLFDTTLNDDVALLDSAFHFDLKAMDEILLNGVRHSFLPVEQKSALEREFRAEMARLKQELALE
jgi:aminodeoxyfutalosine deaminase